MNKKIPTAIAIGIILISAILAGGFIYWRYSSFQEELSNQPEMIIPEKPIDETADWNTYTNEEYRFEIKYPKDWMYEQNVFSLKPDLVFCPLNLTEVHAGETICKLKEEASKPQYEDGMIYLFSYTNDPKPNNLAYHYLGQDPLKKNYYYLYSSVSGNDLIANRILSTFKFINPVTEYLKGIELQYETEIQKESIIVALNDILKLSSEQLKEKRYKDYTSEEDQWDLPTLIYRYFVPDRQGKSLGDNFYYDVKSEEVQKQIKQILELYFK